MDKCTQSTWKGRLLRTLGLERRTERGKARPLRSRTFSVEPLERRELLAVCTWSGGGSDNNWNTAANWQGGVAPVAGDDLVFQGTARTAAVNNYTAGTSFHSLELAANGFTLSGNGLTLTDHLAVDSGVTGSTISAGLALSGTVSVNVVDTTLSLTGVLSGTGSLAKSGTGTLTLTGSNTYAGGTTINAGTLGFANGGLGTSGAITVAADATILWSGSNTRDISGRLAIANGVNATLNTGSNNVTFASAFGGSGSGAITKAGTGTLTLSGNNTYTGGTTVSAGTLAFASGGLGTSGAIAVAANSTLQWSGTNTLDISSRLVLNAGVTATLNVGSNNVTFATAIGSTTAGIAKSGTGTLTLTTANSYSGGTTLNAGTISFVSGGLGTTGTVKFSGTSTLLWASGNTEDVSSRLSCTSGTSIFDVGANTVTFASGFSSSSFAKSGTGSLILASGDTAVTVYATINAGTLQVGAGGTTGSLGTSYCSIVNNGALVFNRSTNITITGGITGSGSVTQQGTGTVYLNASNSYTGGTTLNAGTVSFVNGGLGTSGAITVAGDATLLWGTNSTVDISSRLVIADGVTATLNVGGNNVTLASALGGGGSGAIVKAGTATLMLSGDNTYTGGTTITAGTLAFASGGLGTTGAITVAANSTLLWSDANTLDISGRLVINSGVTATLNLGANNVTFASAIANTAGTLRKTGTGTLTLAAVNTYTGGTTISAGTVVFVSGGLGSSGTIAFTSSATLVWAEGNTEDISSRLSLTSATVTMDVGSNNVTLASAIANSLTVALVKSGSGTLTLAASNNYTGGTTINAGTLQIGTGGATGWLGSGAITNNGILIFNRTGSFTVSSTISGTGSLVQQCGGTLVLSGTNTYTGGTTISAGTVSFSSGGLGTTGTVAIAGSSTLIWSGTNSVDLSSRLAFVNPSTLSLDVGSNSVVFANALSGNSVSLVKAGSGTLTLSGNNTYTGSTSVNAGTLVLGGSNSYTGGTTLANGTTVSFVSGGLSTAGAISISGSSTLLWSGTNTDDISGRLVLNNGAVATLQMGANNLDFATSFGGNSSGSLIKKGSGTLTLAAANTYTGGTRIDAGSILFGSGGLGTSGAITVHGDASLIWAEGNTDDLSSRMMIDQNVTATVDIGSNTVTFASDKSNYGSMIKIGSGTLILTGGYASAWGTATIAEGAIQMGNGGASGSLLFPTIVNNASLRFNRSGSYEFTKPISGTGSVSQLGSGTFTLNNTSNSYTGGTFLYAGTLGFSNGSLGTSGAITVADDAALQWWHFALSGNTQDVSSRLVLLDGVHLTLDTQENNVTFGSSIGSDSSASLTKVGSGTLTFAAANTYTGDTTVNQGTLIWEQGLVLDTNRALTVNNSAVADFLGSQSVTGTGRVVLNGPDVRLKVQGIDSLTPATLTLGAGITLSGQGPICGVYGNEDVMNQGTITVDTGTLTVDLPLENQGTLLVTGDAILNRSGTPLRGTAMAISGTELYLLWTGAESDIDDYQVLLSADNGVTYTALATLSSTDTAFLAGELERNTSYHLRFIATNDNGGLEIYDSGTLSTLDLADTSGAYRVRTENSHLTGPTFLEYAGREPADSTWVYAGSAEGATIRAYADLVKDKSMPTVDAAGRLQLYVFTEGVPAPVCSYNSLGWGAFDYPYGTNSALVSGAYDSALASTATEFSLASDQLVQASTPIIPRWPSAPQRFLGMVLGLFGTPNAGCSSDPIRYFDGAVDYRTTDLQSEGLGSDFSQSRSWTSSSQWTSGQRNGTGWFDESSPIIQQSDGGATISVARSAMSVTTFQLANGQYVPTSYVADTLVHDTLNGEFVWADSAGNEIRFYDFSSSSPAERQGQFKSRTDAGGLLTYVAAWTSDGAIQEVRRQDASSQDVESWYYSYLSGSDPNAGLLSRVQLRQSDGNGGWTVARQVVYEYYETVSLVTDEYGDRGELKIASIEDGLGNVLDTSYYRYYTFGETNGYFRGLKYVFDSASYARLCAAVGDPTVASDAAVAPYAQQYFRYDQTRRCTRHDIQKAGGQETNGIGTFTYQYFSNGTYSTDANDWQHKTIETLPDGNQNTIYSNVFGAVILTDFADLNDAANPTLSGQHWLTYTGFDSQGRAIEEAEPSAVISYQINGNNELLVTLADHAGLIHTTEYYTSTTATGTVAGGVTGFVKNTAIRQGALGTPVLQESTRYYRPTGNNRSNVLVADDTVYRNSDGTGAETTSYNYAWYSGTVQAQSVTVSLPVVTVAQNGSGTADTTIVVYDLYGRPTWTKDADGYLNYSAYDNVTGAVVKTITDVDTTQTADFADLPTGWVTPSGGGLHLLATAVVDALGRTTKLVDPNSNITYYVYDDLNREIRTYADWNATTHNTTGPIAVYREDRAGNYTESLTFIWNDAAGLPIDAQGRPTGAESLTDSRATIESLTRSLLNSAGQATQVRKYVTLENLSYSTARDLGTYGIHYLETDSAYGGWGESVTTRDPSGTIYKQLYDSLGRLTTVLVGTNDTPGLSNMVTFQEFVYDSNGAGDGNLTQETVRPGAGQADRVTQWAYDWRDRQIVSKEGVQTSENSATNRPITYRVLDNLGELLEEDTYDGDGVALASLGATNGVPNAPSASLLRAQSTAAYDEQGRVYRVAEKTVDQSSGNILTSNTTDYWYDRRGELLKTKAPNGSVTKSHYDGAGRVTLEATTDGGGDLTWSDAATVTGDTVLAQISYAYDANGNLTEQTDALNHSTSYGYDALDRLTSQTDANDATTSYAYDAAGNLDSLTDSDQNTTTWHYDPLGRCVQETNELGHSTFYTYDAQGNVASTTDANGQVTTYTYDLLGHETAENWLDSQQNSIRAFGYSYDLVGDLLSASDPTASYSYDYNVLEQLTTITQNIAGLAPTVTFVRQYDANGDRAQLAATIGSTADFVNDYAYDGLGDLLSVRQHDQTGGNAVAEKRVDLTYDAVGQFSTIARYADLAGTELVATGTYGYDLAGQLTSLVYTKGATTLVGYGWTYDTAGNLTEMTNTLDGTADYTNDATGQLTGADYTGGQTDEAYSYDANGNRTNTGYQTGDDNQLLSDGTYTYAYDANGNRTLRYVDTDASGTLTAGDTDITSYAWDYRNRLTAITHYADQAAYSAAQSDQAVEFAYDYQNRLVRETVDSDGSLGTAAIHQTAFVYDGNQIALQFDKTGTGDVAAADLSHRYLWGPAVDQLLADEHVGSLQTPGTVLWSLTDNLNTVRDLATYDAQTDTTTIANHRVYDSYGNLTSQTNAAVDSLFGFTGRQFDQATGLQNNLNRWYDPAVGQWLSQDPLGFAAGDGNLYNYVSNQPTTYVDPVGLAPLAGRIAAGAGAGAASGAATGGLVGGVVGGVGGALTGGWAGARAGAAAGAIAGAEAGAVAGALAGALNAALSPCGESLGDAAYGGAKAGAVAGALSGGAAGLAKGLAAGAKAANEARKAANAALNEFTDPFRGTVRPGRFPKPGEYSPPPPKPPSGYDGWLPPGDQYPGS